MTEPTEPQFVPVPNTVLVTFHYLMDLQETSNTLWFNYTGATIGSALIDALCSQLYTWWSTEVRPLQGAHMHLLDIEGVDQTSQTSPYGGYTPLGTQLGSAGGAPLPNAMSFAVAFKGEARGPWFQGRNYTQGLTAAHAPQNTILPAVADAWVGAYSTLTGDDYVAAEWKWVVASRVFDKQPRDIGQVSIITRVAFTDLNLDTQRRRGRGRGR